MKKDKEIESNKMLIVKYLFWSAMIVISCASTEEIPELEKRFDDNLKTYEIVPGNDLTSDMTTIIPPLIEDEHHSSPVSAFSNHQNYFSPENQ